MNEPGEVDTFELVPRPPVRAYALASLIAAAGAVLTVVSSSAGWGAPATAFCLALLIAGVVLLVAAVVAASKMRVRVSLTDAGYEVTGPGGDRSGTWKDVSRITLAADGHRLTLHHSPEKRTMLVTPWGAHDPELERIGQAMAKRLDADRGYRVLP